MINDKNSANGVTSFLNLILAIYTALRMKIENKNSIIISLISLYIVIEGYGRGSIIFVLIMIGINLIFIFYNLKIKMRMFCIFSLVTIIIFLIPYIYDVFKYTKIISGLDSPRFIILQEYLNKIDVFSLFFGASYENTIIANEYNNNPHIAYIRGHHILGLIYLLGILYIILNKILYTILSRNLVNYIILLIVFNLLIRIMSEPLLFPSLFDSIFLVTLFLISKTIKKESV
ncbi:hypothetical protein ACOL24_08620 [Aliarcobacter butzleri]|uniref:hypothetical protein n=1 Tax=Aliarcobacter butzleri TaxID=28197 RepID=UPI003AFB6AAF